MANIYFIPEPLGQLPNGREHPKGLQPSRAARPHAPADRGGERALRRMPSLLLWFVSEPRSLLNSWEIRNTFHSQMGRQAMEKHRLQHSNLS